VVAYDSLPGTNALTDIYLAQTQLSKPGRFSSTRSMNGSKYKLSADPV